MYAIIESGAKQYRVEEGDIIDVELLKDEKTTNFKQILCIHNGSTMEIGKPYVTNYSVKGEILESIRAPKVIAFRFKRRKNQRRKKGHRQNYCRVKITSITSANASTKEETKEPKVAAKANTEAKTEAKKAAPKKKATKKTDTPPKESK